MSDGIKNESTVERCIYITPKTVIISQIVQYANERKRQVLLSFSNNIYLMGSCIDQILKDNNSINY